MAQDIDFYFLSDIILLRYYILEKSLGMIVLEEKTAPGPTLFVEKRDGRRVLFDVDKIDKALHKAAEKVMDVTPLVEKRLNGLVERIVAEIHSRFPQGVKI